METFVAREDTSQGVGIFIFVESSRLKMQFQAVGQETRRRREFSLTGSIELFSGIDFCSFLKLNWIIVLIYSFGEYDIILVSFLE